MDEEIEKGTGTLNLTPQRVAAAYDIFKKIRNRLRKLRPEEVVHYCMRQLNPGRSFTYEEIMRHPPWLYFLIIKWVV
jgi:hypothetical protein